MEPTDFIFNRVKETRMTDAERSRMRANLLVRMREAQATPSPYVFLSYFNNPIFAGALVLILLVGVGGSTYLLKSPTSPSIFEPTVEGTRPINPNGGAEDTTAPAAQIQTMQAQTAPPS